MSEKTVCLDLDETYTSQVALDEFIPSVVGSIERFLNLIAKRDKTIIESLLPKYQEKLVGMNINPNPNEFIQQFNFNYSEHKWLTKHSDYISAIENAVLHFLNFTIYESKYVSGEKFDALFSDMIRGDIYPLYFLAYTLLDFLPRDTVLDLAMEATDLLYKTIQNQITKRKTLEDMSTSLLAEDCRKTHNFIFQVKDGRYYLKTTRCIWAEIYAELPDLKLASLLDCHGDFSKMPYVNPNFALSRTKTLVEGHSYCDFVHYDKRIDKEIEHPDEDFWKNFK
ncbi:MAG: L-2-amino-thiazoline-4-carboxylic acid hydrolase [Candidatus Heimdallarchaeota archaeon]